MLTKETVQRERGPQAMATVVIVTHEADLGWADMVCVAVEDALPVRAAYANVCLDGYQESEASASALDDASLILLYDMDFTAALATVHALRAHCIQEPLLLVSRVQDEESLLRAYAVGVDECLHATIGLSLLLAKLRAWLRWTPNGPGFAASPGSPC